MPISRIGTDGIENGAVAPADLSTGGPYWDGSGNVGVGTTSPTNLLQATRNQNATTRITVTNSDTTNTSSRAAFQATSGTVSCDLTAIQSLGAYVGTSSSHDLNLVTNGNTRATITSSNGDFLVGGTTARTRFTLQAGEANAPTLGTASGGAFLGNSNVTYGTLFGTSGSGYGWIQQQRVDGTGTAYDLCLQPSGGSLLVGTTTSSGRITSNTDSFTPLASATIRNAAISTTGAYGGAISIIDGTQGYTMWGQSAGADFYIRRATTTGSYTGGVYISNAAGSWSAASDERLKNIHRPIENAADKLSGLRCVFGEYKDNPGIEHPFLIAQDVQVVFPEVVNEFDKENGYLGMSYTDMVPILVKAIQELKAELDATKAEVAALKGAA